MSDVLQCLDIVSELSAGFDTSSSVSTGSQSALLRTGTLIFFVVVTALCQQISVFIMDNGNGKFLQCFDTVGWASGRAFGP